MSISAKELAQKLNISAATVSMVLNRKPGISEKTRNLVLDAAREYGYDFSKNGIPPRKKAVSCMSFTKNTEPSSQIRRSSPS